MMRHNTLKNQSNNRLEAWAMRDDKGLIYYVMPLFFGVAMDKDYMMKNNIPGYVPNLISGRCDQEIWEQIAQQLYAIKVGWANL